jgi:hypothetical protein
VWLQNVVENRRSTEPQVSSPEHGNQTQTDENRGSLDSPISSPATAGAESGVVSAITNQDVTSAASPEEDASIGAVTQQRIATESGLLSQNGTTPPASSRTRARQAEEDYE